MDAKSQLKELREHLGFTQEQLAEEFKVTSGAIALWETGQRPIPGPILVLIEIYEQESGLKPSLARKAELISLTRIGRTTKLANLSLNIFAHWLITNFQQMFLKQETCSLVKQKAYLAMLVKVTKELHSMKGLPQKLAQSMNHLDFALVESADELIAKARSKRKAISPKKVMALFKQELQQTPKKVFCKWFDEPIATASIGQVHYALLKNKNPVAVKLQYPDISKAIHIDLKNLEVFKGLLNLLSPEQEADSISKELKDRLEEECDYRHELNTQNQFHEIYKSHPKILIPKAFEELSTSKILCSEFIHGQDFKSFCVQASQEEKNLAAKAIWEFYFCGLFRFGLLHADPHPDNILFTDKQVAFLDFGCTRKFPKTFTNQWLQLIRAVIEGNKKKMLKEAIKQKTIEYSPNFDSDYYVEMLSHIYRPLLKDEDFAFDKSYQKNTFRYIFKQNPNRHMTRMTQEWVLLTRLIWGLSSVLCRLECKANFYRLTAPIIYGKEFGILPRGPNEDLLTV